MNESSTWKALRNPVFRKLWIATVISGTCVAAHDSAATWMINVSTGSPFFISLMSTVASLPFFLFTLPAGALADKVDRQKLICLINVGLAATAVGLAVLGWLHLLNPYLILASVFFIGIGFAFNAPAWTSIVPQVVSDAELPSAATLSGLQFNISGIIGFAIQHLGDYWTGARWFIDSDGRSRFCLCTECRLLLPRCSGSPSMETTI
jgi:MFS family permease